MAEYAIILVLVAVVGLAGISLLRGSMTATFGSVANGLSTGPVRGGGTPAPAAGLVGSWGSNYHGQLGDSSVAERLMPVAATTASDSALAGKTVTAIAAGDSHTCALDSQGAVYCWGWNDHGQLGNNSMIGSPVPVAVNTAPGSALAGKTVTAIAAGFGQTCALDSQGRVSCWGWNLYGQLGDNNPGTDSPVPVAVNIESSSALHDKTVTAIAAGLSQTCALDSQGLVSCWGENYHGQLGNNSAMDSPVPVTVNTESGSALAGKTVTAIAAGWEHTCALDSQGKVYCWGSNVSGQLGDTYPTTDSNPTTDSPVPVAVNTADSALAGKTVTAIAVGYDHTCALDSQGLVYCWGGNGYGELGDNSTTERDVPVAVNTADSALAGKTVTAITAGGGQTCALSSQGAVYCWGANAYRELGDSSQTDRYMPVAVTTASDSALAGKTVTAIAAGGEHTVVRW